MATDRNISVAKQYIAKESRHTLLLECSPSPALDAHSTGSTKSDFGNDVRETSNSSVSSYSKRSIASHVDTSGNHAPAEKRRRGHSTSRDDFPMASGCPFPSRKGSCKTEHKYFAHLWSVDSDHLPGNISMSLTMALQQTLRKRPSLQTRATACIRKEAIRMARALRCRCNRRARNRANILSWVLQTLLRKATMANPSS